MDFAIIEANGKQYKITPTSEIDVDHMDVEVGKKVTFDKVLMVVDGDKIEMGAPYLENQSFEAEVSAQEKGKKIHIVRFRAKSRHRRHIGFRPQVTSLNFSTKKTAIKTEKKVDKSGVKSEVKKTEAAVKPEKVKKTSSVESPVKKVSKKAK